MDLLTYTNGMVFLINTSNLHLHIQRMLKLYTHMNVRHFWNIPTEQIPAVRWYVEDPVVRIFR